MLWLEWYLSQAPDEMKALLRHGFGFLYIDDKSQHLQHLSCAFQEAGGDQPVVQVQIDRGLVSEGELLLPLGILRTPLALMRG